MTSNHVDNFPPFVSKYTLTALTNCMQKNNGRSNLFKFAQYFTKLIAIRLGEQDMKDPNVPRLMQASVTINTARKMMTLGSWIDTLEANRYQGISTHKDRLRKLSNYINSIYLLFDNIVFLQRVKATNVFGSNAARIGMCAFWFAQLLALMADFIALYETFEKEKALVDISKNPTDFYQLRLGRCYIYATILMRLCNMTYSANAWDLPVYVIGRKLSEKTVAWSGVLASVLAIAQGFHKSIRATNEQYAKAK